MKHRFLFLSLLGLFVQANAADLNLQLFYDFGSQHTACGNQRSPRVTSTVEFFHPDKWGSTFSFIDIDYSLGNNSVNQQDPRNTPFGMYWEIGRNLNFWQGSKVRDLDFHVEYNGGFGIFGNKVVQGGYGINHAFLFGPSYNLHTADYKNIFSLQLLFKYIVDDYNRYTFRDLNGEKVYQSGNLAPLQFTFVWGCQDFCTAKGFTFSGFIDIWGQKMGDGQSWVLISEPQLWYAVGQWFKCPNLCVGTEIEWSYNFSGKGFMCNRCLGLRWLFL